MKENNQGKEILKLIQDNYYIIDTKLILIMLRKLQEIIGV